MLLLQPFRPFLHVNSHKVDLELDNGFEHLLIRAIFLQGKLFRTDFVTMLTFKDAKIHLILRKETHMKTARSF